MGIQESRAGESTNSGSAELRKGKIFAKNTGICDEQDYPGIKLHLGSGKIKWDGWIGVDLYDENADVKCDLKKLSFYDESASVAVAIHVIEHFYEWEVLDLLKEWKRVLVPGGKLILELPCMDKVLNYIRQSMNAEENLTASLSWYAMWGDPRSKSVPMTHKWGYTKQMIAAKLEEAGFAGIKFEEPHYHFPNRDMRVAGFK